jgi:acetyl-CoA C-acetyltransferase
VTRTAVICEPVRTPIGGYGGMFASLTAVDLGVAALKGLLARTGVAPDAVEDVILGHCYPNSEAPAIGRVVAFAAQALACMRAWDFTDADHQRTNVRGSGISLGHPVGATGGRMLATLTRELHRREARYWLETMCIGGGQGLAAVFERVAS